MSSEKGRSAGPAFLLLTTETIKAAASPGILPALSAKLHILI